MRSWFTGSISLALNSACRIVASARRFSCRKFRSEVLQLSAATRRGVDPVQWSQSSFLFAILMLGAGVFLWGTAYKISLYESSPIHNKVPAAKLSTQARTANKDKMASAAAPRDLTASHLLFSMAILLLVLNPLLRRSTAERVNRPLRRWPLHFFPARFLRPPPSLLRG